MSADREVTILRELSLLLGTASRLVGELAELRQAHAFDAEDAPIRANGVAGGMKIAMMSTNHVPSKTHVADVEDVLREVAAFYRFDTKAIAGPKRHAKLTHARHVAFYISRQLNPRPSYPEIGRAFGDRDHTTVISGVQAVEARIARAQHAHMREEIRTIMERLGMSHPQPSATEIQ